MSVQVIMKDGRPEWAVIPYAQYEAMLAAAGQGKPEVSSSPDTQTALSNADQPSVVHTSEADTKEPSVSPVNKLLASMGTTSTTKMGGGEFSPHKLAQLVAAGSKDINHLARDAGISPAYFNQIIQGERAPSPAIVRGLAQALKVKPDDLLG